MCIESALRWAFTQELPNLLEGGGDDALPSMHPMWKMRVDGGRGDWDAAAVSRIVDPDAIAIGAAVARLREKPVELPADLDVDDDVLEQFEARRERAEILVAVHARLGRRPDTDDLPTPFPVLAGNGKPAIRCVAQTPERLISGERAALPREVIVPTQVRARRGAYPTGSFCRLEWIPPLDSIARDRAEYLIWRCALEHLVGELAGLERIEVTGCGAPWRPWDI